MKQLFLAIAFLMGSYSAFADQPHIIRSHPDDKGNYSLSIVYHRTILALTYVTSPYSYTDYSTNIMIGGRNLASYRVHYYDSEFLKDSLLVHPSEHFYVFSENNTKNLVVSIGAEEGMFNTTKPNIFSLSFDKGIPSIAKAKFSDFSLIKEIASENPFYLDKSYAIRKIEERYKTNKDTTKDQIFLDIRELEEKNMLMDYASPECIKLLYEYVNSI